MSVGSLFDTAYERKVEAARKARSSDILENLALDHANIVIQNLLQLAIEEKLDVKIVSGTLYPKCYDEPVRKLVKKLITECKKRVDVVLTDKGNVDEDNPLIALLKKLNMKVSYTTSDEMHFIVVGDMAFRLEVDHEEARALLSFKRPDMAEALNKKYSEISKAAA